VDTALIAIISDTHLPRGDRSLPAKCVSHLRQADLIIHAGDFSSLAVLNQLGEYAQVAAVHGNADSAELCDLLPKRLELTVGAVRLGVLHNAGPAQGRLERLRKSFPQADAVIFGHSHIPLLERDPTSGFQIFNPGSATDKRRQPVHTMGLARISGGAVTFDCLAL
jgi:uncharacterized protein